MEDERQKKRFSKFWRVGENESIKGKCEDYIINLRKRKRSSLIESNRKQRQRESTLSGLVPATMHYEMLNLQISKMVEYIFKQWNDSELKPEHKIRDISFYMNQIVRYQTEYCIKTEDIFIDAKGMTMKEFLVGLDFLLKGELKNNSKDF